MALTVTKALPAPLAGATFNVAAGGMAYLNAIIGYPGTTAPTGAVTPTVNGSNVGVAGPSCVLKALHENCEFVYTDSLPAGTYNIAFHFAADANYNAADGTATLIVH